MLVARSSPAATCWCGAGCAALSGAHRLHAIFGASDSCIAVHPSDMAVALAALDGTSARVEI